MLKSILFCVTSKSRSNKFFYYDSIHQFSSLQIEERDKVIQELQLQCSQNFKEEEERFGLEEEQVALFKDLVFKSM